MTHKMQRKRPEDRLSFKACEIDLSVSPWLPKASLPKLFPLGWSADTSAEPVARKTDLAKVRIEADFLFREAALLTSPRPTESRPSQLRLRVMPDRSRCPKNAGNSAPFPPEPPSPG
jgi:hypothetical protein